MNPYYYDELPTASLADDEVLVIFALVLLGIVAVIAIASLVLWVIRSLSLYRLAKRRLIDHAWLAWIPFGSQWILGSIADQYQLLVQKKVTSRRMILLVLSLAGIVLAVVNGVFSALRQWMMIGAEEELLVLGLVSLLPALAVWGVSIATMVFYHICNYDLYRSCDPKNAAMFLVLGILLPVTEPFFYLVCRKKDLGMVPPNAPDAPASPTNPYYGARPEF